MSKGRSKTKSGLLRFLATLMVLALLAGIACVGLSAYVCAQVQDRILAPMASADLAPDCILVLGAAIWEGNVPCPMLADRLDQAVELYELGVSEVLLMSGDEKDLETQVMGEYVISRGVPPEAVVLDPEGYSTYESLQRARDEFGAGRILIVTQRYHLYRALYIAQQLGLEAYGVASDPRRYAGQVFRELREVLARDKDYFKCRLEAE